MAVETPSAGDANLEPNPAWREPADGECLSALLTHWGTIYQIYDAKTGTSRWEPQEVLDLLTAALSQPRN